MYMLPRRNWVLLDNDESELSDSGMMYAAPERPLQTQLLGDKTPESLSKFRQHNQ